MMRRRARSKLGAVSGANESADAGRSGKRHSAASRGEAEDAVRGMMMTSGWQGAVAGSVRAAIFGEREDGALFDAGARECRSGDAECGEGL